jgi:hypothetical protein
MSELPPLDHMSERELLLLACERINTVGLRLSSHHEKMERHDRRISALETWRTFLAGAWAVISGLGVALWERR